MLHEKPVSLQPVGGAVPSSAQLSGSAASAISMGVVAGGPLGIVTIMLWESYTGHTLTSIEGSAIGTLGSAVFGFAWHAITRLIEKLINLLP